MNEAEIETNEDAAFYVANEVLNEYHAFPVVQRRDIEGDGIVYVQINMIWFRFRIEEVLDPGIKDRLEALVP